ncbi:sensor histidine kinase [Roseateles chitosanitabidus]|uniref:sensor histidine kinase n=1 Tax=Roseateles chitosanitabidus TaxID=65048 RepID=UPI00083727F8|nr:ATP-binding protein [Roseateles chitosanitabidus]
MAYKIRWPNSLRNRVLAVLAVSMALSALLVGAAASLLWDPFSRWVLRTQIEDNGVALVGLLRFDAQGRPTGFDARKIEPWVFDSFRSEVMLRVSDAQGQVIFSTDGQTGLLTRDGARFEPRRQAFSFVRDGVAMHGTTIPFQRDGRQLYGQFAVTDRVVLLMRTSIGFDVLRQGTLALGGTFVLVFLVILHHALWRALKPVRQASSAARRIAPRTLGERLSVADQPRELRPLVEAFNAALDRLQRGFQTQQDFLSNAAHELKTPLALIRAQVELTEPGIWREQVLEDVDRVARQVQQLLLLAEASEPQNYRIEAIDPGPAVREVFDFMERVATRRGVTLGLRLDPALCLWRADRGALFTLLKNLVENAIQHSPPGGVVTLAAGPAGFSVSDQGRGVDPRDLPRIFERFWRGADRREQGAGLGLAICTEIAAAHGWRLSAQGRSPGLAVRCGMTAEAEAPDDRDDEDKDEAGGPPPSPRAPMPMTEPPFLSRRSNPAAYSRAMLRALF